MIQMSDDRPGQTISDTMTGKLSHEKARCMEIPACLQAYDRESSRRRLLTTNTNELPAASRHILAFSSPDITSPVDLEAVCETVVSDTRDCRCVMGYTPIPWPKQQCNQCVVNGEWDCDKLSESFDVESQNVFIFVPEFGTDITREMLAVVKIKRTVEDGLEYEHLSIRKWGSPYCLGCFTHTADIWNPDYCLPECTRKNLAFSMGAWTTDEETAAKLQGPNQLNRREVAADGSLPTRHHLRSHISWYNTIGFLLPCDCA